MTQHPSQTPMAKPHRTVTALLRTAFVAALLATTLPLHADDRAIQRRVAPVYPEIARRMRVSGIVRVAATVAPDGSVTATKTVSGNHMLSGAAEEAVHKWKFASASDETTVEVDINFALN